MPSVGGRTFRGYEGAVTCTTRYAGESLGPLRGPTFAGITEKEGFEPSKEVKTPLTP